MRRSTTAAIVEVRRVLSKPYASSKEEFHQRHAPKCKYVPFANQVQSAYLRDQPRYAQEANLEAPAYPERYLFPPGFSSRRSTLHQV